MEVHPEQRSHGNRRADTGARSGRHQDAWRDMQRDPSQRLLVAQLNAHF
jgi:hypothetical protein